MPCNTFIDDRDGNEFKVMIFRSADLKKDGMTLKINDKNKVDPKEAVLLLLKTDPKVSYDYLAKQMGVSVSTIKRLLLALKNEEKVRRIGAKRGGMWEVVL